MSHSLEARAITFGYERGEAVVQEVGFSLRSGNMLAIVGPNGSGKSTLLKIAAGLLSPDAGDVLLDGKRLKELEPAARARTLGYLPQAVAPAFSLTVNEVVALGRFGHGGLFGGISEGDSEVIERALAMTESADLAERSFETLSGGERQRVLLATVLAQEAELLLLDEPTAALDLHHEAEVFALLRRLADDGRGIVVVTHDLNLAALHCDQILLLGRDHRMHAIGAVTEVLTAERLSNAYGGVILVGRHPFHEAPYVGASIK